MRETRTYGLNGDLRKRSRRATAPEVYQWYVLTESRWVTDVVPAVSSLRVQVPPR
jgi:hypothetical protein